MTRTILIILTLVATCFFYHDASAQKGKKKKRSEMAKNAEDMKIFEEGEFWFDLKGYKRALTEYEKLLDKYPEESILHLKAGICYIYQPDGYEKALSHLNQLDKSDFKTSEISYYKGKALHLNNKFEEAIAEFQTFINGKGGTKEERIEAGKLIKNCENGIELMKTPVEVEINNIGAPVNTENSEYVPLVSSDESVLMFTYRGDRSVGGLQGMPDETGHVTPQYAEDILISYKDSLGNWGEPELLPEQINTLGNDACVALENSGNSFHMFRSINNDLGTIYKSELQGEEWTEPVKLEGEVNTKYWEGSFTVSPDGQKAYFASERPGGKGGRDLYEATLMPDGSWGRVKNMENLNTELDDDAAFIHSSGLYLIFSSQGHNSMGGNDIFRASLVNDTVWANPVNLGYPINTPGDDKFYVVSAGNVGYYASAKQGGYGSFDIYSVEPGLPGVKIPMVQLKGDVMLNDKPVPADIEVTFTNTGREQGKYKNNASNGRYLMDFPAKRKYNVLYKLEDGKSELKAIDAEDVDEFLEIYHEVRFYTDEYLAQKKREKDSLVTAANIPPAKDTSDLIKQFGGKETSGLIFRVQIGAYNFPQNFVYTAVKNVGKVEKIKLEDNITRFVMGTFTTYNDAAQYRDIIIMAGITDAFVTGIYENKRYLLAELVEKGILVK